MRIYNIAMIDDTTTKKIAKLSRIAITDDEVSYYKDRLNGVLGWVDQLQAVDTDGIEPLTSVLIEAVTPQREDKVTDGGYASKVLSNAPETKAGFFVVPKVIE